MIKHITYGFEDGRFLEASMQLSSNYLRLRARLVEDGMFVVQALKRDYACDIQGVLAAQIDIFAAEFEKLTNVSMPRPLALMFT